MKKKYEQMNPAELLKEHFNLICKAEEAETDRQSEIRWKKVEEFEKKYLHNS